MTTLENNNTSAQVGGLVALGLEPKKYDYLTASSAETAEHVKAEFLKEAMNHVEKAKRLRDLTFRLTSDGQLMLNAIGERTPERIAATRRYVEAQVAWLKANPGDDLTPERVAMWVKWAKDDLPNLQALSSAVSWVKEVEQDDDEPSKTCKALESRFERAAKEAGEHLGCALRVDQVELLHKIYARTYRFQKRFRVFNLYRSSSGPFKLVHLTVRVGYGFYDFGRLVEQAATLSEVRQLANIWHTAFVSSREDGVTVLRGEGIEIRPL